MVTTRFIPSNTMVNMITIITMVTMVTMVIGPSLLGQSSK